MTAVAIHPASPPLTKGRIFSATDVYFFSAI